MELVLGVVIGFALGTFTWWKFGKKIEAWIEAHREE